MKIGLICTSFLILFSCKNATVDLESISISSNAALIKLSDGKQISQIQNPNFMLAYYYEDRMVGNLAIYDSSNCDETMRLGEIPNQIGSSLTSSLQLIEGSHDFYYKPVSGSAELNLTALCSPTGLNYVVDRTPPNSLALTLVTAYLTADRNIGLTVSGCENTMIGASSLIFKEQVSPSPPIAPTPSDLGWQDCQQSQVFTISSALGSKSIYAFAKDAAGNVSPASMGVSVTLTTPPILSAPASPLIATINNTILTVSLSAPGSGVISSCSSIPNLPAGLAINTSSCEISGTPTVVSASSLYRITATGAGSSSTDIFIEVKSLPRAFINFNSFAGPGITTIDHTGGQPHITYMKANVSGDYIDGYKYFIDNSNIGCGTGTYTLVNDILQPMEVDLFTNNEVQKRICIKARRPGNIWQPVATLVTWMPGPILQKLVDDFIDPTKRIITKYDQDINADSISRTFLVGGSIPRTITCNDVFNCSIDKNGDGSWQAAQVNLLPTDKVRFKIVGIANPATEVSVIFNVSDVMGSYTFKIRTAAAACSTGTVKKVFLTRALYDGNLSGISGADNLCAIEANALNIVTTTSWKAMIQRGMSDGLTSIGTYSVTYCDAPTNRPILSGLSGTSYNFENSFTKFINGVGVNGGNDTEWQYIPNAPRYLSATEFWYGSSSCNCGNWMSNADINTCGTFGRLTHESSANNPFIHLPGNAGAPITVNSCSQPRHLVCYEL